MTLEDLGNLGEIVGGLGVIVSLVYLARQIRQNTPQLEENARVTRAATANQVLERMAQTNMLTVSNPEVADLWRRATFGEGLDPTELIRYLGLLVYLFRSCEAAHYQAALGVFDPTRLDFAIGPTLRWSLQSPITRDYWGRARSLYPEAFRRYVDAVVADLDRVNQAGRAGADAVYSQSTSMQVGA